MPSRLNIADRQCGVTNRLLIEQKVAAGAGHIVRKIKEKVDLPKDGATIYLCSISSLNALYEGALSQGMHLILFMYKSSYTASDSSAWV